MNDGDGSSKGLVALGALALFVGLVVATAFGWSDPPRLGPEPSAWDHVFASRVVVAAAQVALVALLGFVGMSVVVQAGRQRWLGKFGLGDAVAEVDSGEVRSQLEALRSEKNDALDRWGLAVADSAKEKAAREAAERRLAQAEDDLSSLRSTVAGIVRQQSEPAQGPQPGGTI